MGAWKPTGSSQPGSGLGWSIVRRVGLVHGAELQAARCWALGGPQVTVTWPAGPVTAS